MNQPPRMRLSALHGTLGCLAAAVCLVLLFVWPGVGRLQGQGSLHWPATCFQAAAFIYLAATAAVQVGYARLLRRGEQAVITSLIPLLGHMWVFMVVGAAALRGPSSRALLAGLDRLLAAVATVSLLCLIALLVTAWIELRSLPKTSKRRRPPSPRSATRLGWVQGLAGILLVLSVWYLESRPFDLRGQRSSPASERPASPRGSP